MFIFISFVFNNTPHKLTSALRLWRSQLVPAGYLQTCRLPANLPSLLILFCLRCCSCNVLDSDRTFSNDDKVNAASDLQSVS